MIEARELRIGNLVQYLSTRGNMNTVVVDSINHEGIDLHVDLDNYGDNEIEPDLPFDVLSPILLTEEWLLKRMTFKKEEEYYFLQYPFLNWGMRIVFFADSWVVSHGFMNIWNELTSVKHVHQLQNLYFALTGEELKLKES